MIKLLSLELGFVGIIFLAITVADIPAITAALTAATVLIGALGYWIIQIVNAIKAKTDAVLSNQAALAVTAADVLARQEIIAVKVDGTASAAVAKIDLLQQQITTLLADQAERKETAARLATAAAKTPTVP